MTWAGTIALTMVGLLGGSGTQQRQPSVSSGVFAAENGEGKQVKDVETVISHPAVCFHS